MRSSEWDLALEGKQHNYSPVPCWAVILAKTHFTFADFITGNTKCFVNIKIWNYQHVLSMPE
jgi:hypothetical protein